MFLPDLTRVMNKKTFCHFYIKSKIPFISNLKTPLCASKGDDLELYNINVKHVFTKKSMLIMVQQSNTRGTLETPLYIFLADYPYYLCESPQFFTSLIS
jgi:hypothetical protein